MKQTKETYYCDRCKKKLDKEPLFYIKRPLISKTFCNDMRIEMLCRERTFADLCNDCKRLFIKWWEGGAE